MASCAVAMLLAQAAEKKGRQRRTKACERRKAIEELILRPEHDGGPQDDRRGKFRQNRHFARSLRAGVFGTRFAVGADRRDMNETGGRP